MAIKREAAPNVLQRLQRNNIKGTVIGEFTPKDQGYKLIDDEVEADLPYYSTDPYWAAFFNAYKNGWK
jgi:hydrogenase expression/formation protein HypE